MAIKKKSKVIKLPLTDEMYFYLKQKENVFGSVQEYIRTLIYNDMHGLRKGIEVQEATYEKKIPVPIPQNTVSLHEELMSELKATIKKRKINF